MRNEAIIIAIITSLVASIVFWVVFNCIPAIIKYVRIRPRVEKDIVDINMHLLFFIQIPFQQSLHTSTPFQLDIKDKRIRKEDYENALYGKCLSDERCHGEFEHRLLSVGSLLSERASELDVRLDRIQRYAGYIRTRETLLLKEIGEKLHTYGFEEYKSVVDGTAFVSVNPTISYMNTNFYDLYLLYHRLDGICNSFILINRTAYERYLIVRRALIQNRYLMFCAKRAFLDTKYKALIDTEYYFRKSNIKKVKESLRKYLDCEKEHLICLRGLIKFIDLDGDYRSFIISIRGEDEVQEWLDCIRAEDLCRKRFELRNIENKEIIENMVKNTPKIMELGEEELGKINKLFDGYI